MMTFTGRKARMKSETAENTDPIMLSKKKELAFADLGRETIMFSEHDQMSARYGDLELTGNLLHVCTA